MMRGDSGVLDEGPPAAERAGSGAGDGEAARAGEVLSAPDGHGLRFVPGSLRRREDVDAEKQLASTPPPTATFPSLPSDLPNRNPTSVQTLEPSLSTTFPHPDGSTLYPEGGLPAYLVVLGSFAGLLAAFGLMNTVGTFQAYLSVHQLAAYPPSTTGWIFSLYIFLAFFGGVLVGPVFDAHGPRWLVAAGSAMLVAGGFGLAESRLYWHFVVSFSLLGGLGTCLIFTPAVGAVGHFFAKRRGAATGLAATGGSMGGIVFPLLLPPLIERVGYPWAVRVMTLVFVVLLAIANALIRSRLPPKPGGSVWPDPMIFRNRLFTLTTAGVFFIEWGLFVPLSYLPSYALQVGIDAQLSYQLLALLNVGSFFGRWMPGYVADRWGRFNAMIGTVLLCILFLFAFWLPSTVPAAGAAYGSVPLAVVFAVGFGFASGSNISLTPVCIGQLCETEEYGRWYATCYTVVSFGCLTGIPLAGELVRVGGGGYLGLVGFTAGCYVIGLWCFVVARGLGAGWDWRKIY